MKHEQYFHSTKESYNAIAHVYAGIYPKQILYSSSDPLLDQLPKQAAIIDIGCGHGTVAKFFTEKGFKVLGIDFSEKMIDIARKQAPLAEFRLMNMLELNLPKESFDFALASASILHIPKKRVPELLAKIYSFLKKQSWFQIVLKEGEGEIFEENVCNGKFWAFYRKSEIFSLLEAAGFTVEKATILETPHNGIYPVHYFLNILTSKKTLA